MDKCRKRGERIAEKRRYRNHERDNFAKPHGWRYVICGRWNDHPKYPGCRGCEKKRYEDAGGPVLDNDLAEFERYGE